MNYTMKMRSTYSLFVATLSLLSILLIPTVFAQCPSGLCCLPCPPPPPPSPPPPSPPPPPPSPPPPIPSPPPPSPPPPSPPPPTPSPDITEIISGEIFDEMLLHRNDSSCAAKGFYTYDAFVEAARYFSDFATTGDIDDRKREVAAFLAQTSHETQGGPSNAPYTWGYCIKSEAGNPEDLPTNCVNSTEWPCKPGRKYYGRGPFQIKFNYNYGPCGDAIREMLLYEPNLLADDNVISFKSALWFWMTPQSPKPSCHDVILGIWEPTSLDIEANRLPGFGVTTNIINGKLECGHGRDPRSENRIGYYLRYCQILGVTAGENIECSNQQSFGNSLLLVNSM